MTCTIHTFTGKDVNPLALRLEDICIEDIAHALACCNRFAGHCRRPVSVAQHSVYVSRLCEGTGYELQGLLHDGSEAFLSDVTKWLKATPAMKGYREAEERAQRAVYEKFGCCWTTAPVVEWADRVMVRFEGMRSFKGFRINHPNYPPLTAEELAAVGYWQPWTWRQAEADFLARFTELRRRDAYSHVHTVKNPDEVAPSAAQRGGGRGQATPTPQGSLGPPVRPS